MSVGLYYIKDLPSGFPISPVIACNSELAALQGFSGFLTGQASMDPRCYALYKIPTVLDDSFNVTFCELGPSTLICRGDDVDACITSAIANLTFKE